MNRRLIITLHVAVSMLFNAYCDITQILTWEHVPINTEPMLLLIIDVANEIHIQHTNEWHHTLNA